MSTRRWRLLAGVAALCIAPLASAGTSAPVFKPAPCPDSVAQVARCHAARDGNDAWLLVAMPRQWNHRLIVHAHGGPRLKKPQDGDTAEDLDRYSVMVRAGYAWIGTTYRRGGYGVRMAAADVDNARRAFVAQWGRPQRIVLHGQSWGGNVAAKVAELHALDEDGKPNYDGVLLTNGVLMGGTRAYAFRADLRAVYQYYCRNHPRPDETQYPLWQGLPADTTMTRRQLRHRVDECTGIDREPGKRTPEQAARLRDILAVTGIDEDHLVSHLSWATLHFQDLVQRRLDGRNPFDNTATVYRGSHDDEALNAGVARFSADPGAVARLAYDADLSGLIVLPTVAVHALHDPVVTVEADAAYARTVVAAGRGALLARVITDEGQHSRLRDSTYVSVLLALENWLDGGARPTPDGIQAGCQRLAKDPSDCRFLAPHD